MNNLQLPHQFKELNRLQQLHGDPSLLPVYGAGCLDRPKIMFLFMNPTGRNITAYPEWQGIRAPWLGTKNVWKLFYQVQLLPVDLFTQTQTLKPAEWTEALAEQLYRSLAEHGVYVTNMAKCTQVDARPLPNTVFKDYLPQTYEEIDELNPERIVSFGKLRRFNFAGLRSGFNELAPVQCTLFRGKQ